MNQGVAQRERQTGARHDVVLTSGILGGIDRGLSATRRHLGTGPFFGEEACLERQTPAENMDLSPSASRDRRALDNSKIDTGEYNMTRIGPGTVAAGALAIFLVLVTAYAAGRLSVDAPPSACETTTGCSRCAPAEADAAPATPSTPAAECENVKNIENVGTPAIDGGPQPTLAFPTELPPRNRGLVIEVPVEAELAPVGANHL
jgi:hypothetical protein